MPHHYVKEHWFDGDEVISIKYWYIDSIYINLNTNVFFEKNFLMPPD